MDGEQTIQAERTAGGEAADRPKVGVGVLVLNGDRVLLGRRRSGHGQRTWQPPGGHLEHGESVEDCARREVREEAGLHLRDLARGPYTNDYFADEGRHYVSLFVIAAYDGGDPRPLEPDKIEGWSWFRWDDLPDPLFLPLEHLRRSGYSPFTGRPAR
jgi:8-oxo-dGTP diphosphatase